MDEHDSHIQSQLKEIYNSSSCVGERVCILVGSTGSGKSATGNLLAGINNAFVSTESISSSEVESKKFSVILKTQTEGEIQSIVLHIVDTPGYGDTKGKPNDLLHETLKDYLRLQIRKINLILFITKKGRLLPEERECLRFMKSSFGPASKCCALVVTHCEKDNEDSRKNLFEQWQSEMELIDFCGKGLLFIGNIESNEQPADMNLNVLKRIHNDQKKLRELVWGAKEDHFVAELFPELTPEAKKEMMERQALFEKLSEENKVLKNRWCSIQ